jgi:hypothetical protein
VRLALVLLLLSAAVPAQAQAQAQSGRHGDGHAQGHDWYQPLKQPGTTASCCNGRRTGPDGKVEGDCRPTRAWQKDDGSWVALLDGRWVPVPPRVVLKELAPDGGSHICANDGGVIYCFIGGSPKS